MEKEVTGTLYEITVGGKRLDLKDLPIKLKSSDQISINWEIIHTPKVFINGVELK